MNWDLSVSWTRTTRIQTQKFKKKKKNILQPSQSLTLGLITFHLLVLLSPSIFRWRNSSPAPPSSSQAVLRFDFLVCSVNQVHQSHRQSGFVSSIWVLGLFVDAILVSATRFLCRSGFYHWVLVAWFVLLKTVKDHLSLLGFNLFGFLPISSFFLVANLSLGELVEKFKFRWVCREIKIWV